MIEFTPRKDSSVSRNIKIIGIGGAGANALDRMALDGVDPSCLVAINTEAQALVASVAGEKIQLGVQSTRGLGAGGDPELGRCAAEEATTEIRSALEGVEAVFILAGLGGGTGSGAAPLVVELAREAGALVIALVTLPFNFEGKRRATQAAESLAFLQQYADAVLCFENDRMGDSIPPKAGVQAAFAAADSTLSQCVQSLAAMFNRTGLIHLGLDELASVLQSVNARCLFGFGEAEGNNRPYDALSRALKNPLMDKGRMLRDCPTVLIQVSGGPDLTLDEVQLLMEEFNRYVDDRTRILFGTAVAPELAGRMTVTILSSIGDEQPAAVRPQPLATSQRIAPVVAAHPPLPTQAPIIPAKDEVQAEVTEQEEEFIPEAETDFQPELAETEEIESAQPAFEPELEPLVEEETETLEPEPETIAQAEEPPVVQTPPAPRFEKPRGLCTATSQASLFGDDEPAAPVEKEAPVERPVPGRMLRRPYPVKPAAPEPAPVAEAAPEPDPEPSLIAETSPQPEAETELEHTIESSLEPELEVVSEFPVEPVAEPEQETIIEPELEQEPESAATYELAQPSEPEPEQSPAPKIAPRPAFIPRMERRPMVAPQPRSPEPVPVAEPVTPPPAAPVPTSRTPQQEVLQFEPVTRGRFEKSEPTIVDGQDLDVPTYLRRRVKLR